MALAVRYVHRQLALTPRQREVLALVAEGLTDRQVAVALGITPRTAGTHLKNAFTRLGVHNRTAAVVAAHRLGEVVL